MTSPGFTLPSELVDAARKEREDASLSTIGSDIDSTVSEGMGALKTVAGGYAQQLAPALHLLSGGELKMPSLDDLTPQWIKDQQQQAQQAVQNALALASQSSTTSQPTQTSVNPRQPTVNSASGTPAAMPTGAGSSTAGDGSPPGPLTGSDRPARIASALPYAQQAEQRTGVPADVNLAFAVHESGLEDRYGPGMSYHGRHAVGDEPGTPITDWGYDANGNRVDYPTKLKSYSDASGSFSDFADLIANSPLYQPALQRYQQSGDKDQLIRDIWAAGYGESKTGPDETVNIRQNQTANVQPAPGAQNLAKPSKNEQNLAPAGGAPSSDIAQAALDDPDKWALCGPVAALIAAGRRGAGWTLAQAKRIAQDSNLWDAGTGMHGLQSEVDLLNKMNVSARTGPASLQHLIADAQAGNTPIVSTPGHYFILTGYDPQTGKFDTSTTGTALRAGSRQLSLDEIASLGGGIQGAAYMDNPTSPAPSAVAPPTPVASSRAAGPAPADAIPSASAGASNTDGAVWSPDAPARAAPAYSAPAGRGGGGGGVMSLQRPADPPPYDPRDVDQGPHEWRPEWGQANYPMDQAGRPYPTGSPAVGSWPGDSSNPLMDDNGQGAPAPYVPDRTDPTLQPRAVPNSPYAAPGRAYGVADDAMYRQPMPGTSQPIANPDGSVTTERSITVTEPGLNGGRATNIPTVWDGRIVSDDEAVQNAIRSGVAFPSFDSIPEAVSAAEQRSRDLGTGQATSVGGATVPPEVQNALPNRNRPVRGEPVDETGGLQYRQSLGATGGPDTTTGDQQPYDPRDADQGAHEWTTPTPGSPQSSQQPYGAPTSGAQTIWLEPNGSGLPSHAPMSLPATGEYQNPDQPQQSTYNDPTDQGTISQPLPPQQPDVAIGSGTAPNDQTDWRVTPTAPPPTPQQQPAAPPSGFPGLQAVYDSAGNFLHWIQGAAQGVQNQVDSQMAGPVRSTPGEPDYAPPYNPVQKGLNDIANEGIATPIGRGLATGINTALGRPTRPGSGGPETSIDTAITQTARSLPANIAAAQQGYEQGNWWQAGLGALGAIGDLAPSTTLARQLNEMLPKADTPVGEVGAGDVVMGAALLHGGVNAIRATPALVRGAAALGYGALQEGGRIADKIAQAISEGVPAEQFSQWLNTAANTIDQGIPRLASSLGTAARGIGRGLAEGAAAGERVPAPGEMQLGSGFVSDAARGSVQQAPEGPPQWSLPPGVADVRTPISAGLSSGYSPDDIKAFYLNRRWPAEWDANPSLVPPTREGFPPYTKDSAARIAEQEFNRDMAQEPPSVRALVNGQTAPGEQLLGSGVVPQGGGGAAQTPRDIWEAHLTNDLGVQPRQEPITEPYTDSTGRQVTRLQPAQWHVEEGANGVPEQVQTRKNFFGNLEEIPGTRRPLDSVYRVMSRDEYEQAVQRGYLQSDGRLNVAEGEGTVTSPFAPSVFYSPKNGDAVAVRIRVDPQDGWRLDHDGYIKTGQTIPVDRIEATLPYRTNASGNPVSYGPPQQAAGSGAVPRLSPALRASAFNAAQGGVLGAVAADQQDQAEGGTPNYGRRLAYGLAGAGLAVAAGSPAARGIVGRALGSGFVPRSANLEARLAGARSTLDEIAPRLDQARIAAENAAEGPAARAANRAYSLVRHEYDRAVGTVEQLQQGLRDANRSMDASGYGQPLADLGHTGETAQAADTTGSQIPRTVDDTPRTASLGSGVVPQEPGRYDPRLAQEPVLPGMEPPNRAPGDAGPPVSDAPNRGRVLGDIPPSQVREPTLPGVQGPPSRVEYAGNPNVSDAPNRGRVLGDVPPSQVREPTLPGVEPPYQPYEQVGPLGQSDDPNRGRVLGDIPPSQIRRPTLPGVEPPYQPYEQVGPLGQSDVPNRGRVLGDLPPSQVGEPTLPGMEGPRRPYEQVGPLGQSDAPSGPRSLEDVIANQDARQGALPGLTPPGPRVEPPVTEPGGAPAPGRNVPVSIEGAAARAEQGPVRSPNLPGMEPSAGAPSQAEAALAALPERVQNYVAVQKQKQPGLDPLTWFRKFAAQVSYSSLIGPTAGFAKTVGDASMAIGSHPKEITRAIMRGAPEEYPQFLAGGWDSFVHDIGPAMLDAIMGRGQYGSHGGASLSSQTNNPVGKWAATALEAGGRVEMGLPTAIFGEMARGAGERLAAAQAATDAVRAGHIDKADWAPYVQSLVQDARNVRAGGLPTMAETDGVIKAGVDYGKQQTFQNPVGPVGQAVSHLAGAKFFPRTIERTAADGTKTTQRIFDQPIPIVSNFLNPIFGVPWNMHARLAESSPLGLLAEGVRSARGTGPSFDKTYDAVVGSAVIVGLAGLAGQGLMTGAGNPDPQKYAEDVAQGFQRYSTLVNGVYVPNKILYGMFAPAANMAGDLHDSIVYRKPGTSTHSPEVGIAALSRVGSQLRQEAFLQPLADTLSAMGTGAKTQSIGSGLAQYAASNIDRAIPYGSTGRVFGTSQDTVERAPDRGAVSSFGDQVNQRWRAGVGIRSAEAPAQDVLGRTLPNQQSGFGALIGRTTTPRPDPALQVFQGAGVDIPGPPQTLNLNQRTADGQSVTLPIPMTGYEQRAWNTIRGQAIVQQIDPNLARSQAWQQASPADQQTYLQARIRDADEYAKTQMQGMIGDAELRRRIALLQKAS